MATVATYNVSAAREWTLVGTASGNETWSLNFEGAPVAIAITTTASAPSASLAGDRLPAGGKSVTLNANDRVWQRDARNRTIGQDPQLVITKEV